MVYSLNDNIIRQLVYGNDHVMKICNSCGVYLKESLASTDTSLMIKRYKPKLFVFNFA